MRCVARGLTIAAIAALLTACSGSGSNTSFETEGLIAPEGSCRVKPSRLGIAEPLGRINEGNGCRIPDPWEVRSVGSVGFSHNSPNGLTQINALIGAERFSGNTQTSLSFSLEHRF